MPKSNFRYKYMEQKVGSSSGFQTSSTDNTVLSTPPRKVSFEDSSDISICSDGTIQTKNNKSMPANKTAQSEGERRTRISRKRSLLVRPITSLSLVDLAKSDTYDGLSPVKSDLSDGDDTEGRDAKRIRSFNLSPRSVLHASDLPDANRQALYSLQRTSPWGHFVDMSPDEDEYLNLPTSSYLNHDCRLKTNREKVSPISWNESLCRTRRRPSPYGQHKCYTRRQRQPTLTFAGVRADTKPEHKFRLSPRSNDWSRRSTDELIGVFSELNVRQASQESA